MQRRLDPETGVKKPFENFDYNKNLVSLATHNQYRLNSFQTVKTLFCIALPGHFDFVSFLGCALFSAGEFFFVQVKQCKKESLQSGMSLACNGCA